MHSLTHSPTHSLTHSLTHLLTHSLTHSLTVSPLTPHSLASIAVSHAAKYLAIECGGVSDSHTHTHTHTDTRSHTESETKSEEHTGMHTDTRIPARTNTNRHARVVPPHSIRAHTLPSTEGGEESVKGETEESVDREEDTHTRMTPTHTHTRSPTHTNIRTSSRIVTNKLHILAPSLRNQVLRLARSPELVPFR